MFIEDANVLQYVYGMCIFWHTRWVMLSIWLKSATSVKLLKHISFKLIH